MGHSSSTDRTVSCEARKRFYKTKKESGEKKLIDALFANALMCMALNIYHEARNESTAGQLAVGQVVMNRVYDDRFPDTVCGVVSRAFIGKAYQHVRWQFSWYRDGPSDKPRNKKAF